MSIYTLILRRRCTVTPTMFDGVQIHDCFQFLNHRIILCNVKKDDISIECRDRKIHSYLWVLFLIFIHTQHCPG